MSDNACCGSVSFYWHATGKPLRALATLRADNTVEYAPDLTEAERLYVDAMLKGYGVLVH